MTSKYACGALAELKKTDQKYNQKDGGATTTNTVPKEAVHKHQKDKKIPYSRVYKGYELQAELKEQNKNLTAANERLKKNLAETQLQVDELELKFVEKEREKEEAQKSLKHCHMLLVSAMKETVSEEGVGKAAQEHEEQREEVNHVSVDLLNELKNFGNMASEQRSQLQELEGRMQELATARDHMTRERENFCEEVDEMERALEEAEALLM